MAKKVYGIDLDGVCFDFVTEFSKWLKRELGVDYDDSEIVDYHWYNCIESIGEKEFFREFHRFGKAGSYATLPLLPGAAQAIKHIRENGHRVWFVTARPIYAKEDTLRAVSNAFGFTDTVVFSGGKDYKSETVNLLNIDVFVEDGPHYAESIAKNTKALVYLMDHPYNKKVSHPNIIRVNSWDDIMQEEGFYENSNSTCRQKENRKGHGR